jgi:hypothetical protein
MPTASISPPRVRASSLAVLGTSTTEGMTWADIHAIDDIQWAQYEQLRGYCVDDAYLVLADDPAPAHANQHMKCLINDAACTYGTDISSAMARLAALGEPGTCFSPQHKLKRDATQRARSSNHAPVAWGH